MVEKWGYGTSASEAPFAWRFTIVRQLYAPNSHAYDNEPMVGELLASALEVAQHSKPDVRVAALLRIARVQTVLDRGQARRTFEQALDTIRRIPGRDGAFLLEHARLFAAAIAPDLTSDYIRALRSRESPLFVSECLDGIDPTRTHRGQTYRQ